MDELNERITSLYRALGATPPKPVHMPELDEATRKIINPLMLALKTLPLPDTGQQWRELRVAFLKNGDTIYVSEIQVMDREAP